MSVLSVPRMAALSPVQCASLIGIIEVCGKEANARGWPLSAILVACVANAQAESSLDPRAIGDSGHAFGLYQFNDAGSTSLGTTLRKAGWTTRDLQDPHAGTVAILWEACKSSRFRSACASGSIADAVRYFTLDAERPTNSAAKAEERVGIARGWLADPRFLNMRGADVDRAAFWSGTTRALPNS